MRMAGKTAGIATLVLDVAKGAVPTLLGVIFLVPWQAAMVGLASFLGHIFPVFLRFKGGKGVATALGVWMILSPPAFLGVVALILFLAWRTGHMSAGIIGRMRFSAAVDDNQPRTMAGNHCFHCNVGNYRFSSP